MKRFEKLLSRLIGEDMTTSNQFYRQRFNLMADAVNRAGASELAPTRGMLCRMEELTLDTPTRGTGWYLYSGPWLGEPGMFAVISMSDTGRWMDKETCKIFEPFFLLLRHWKGYRSGTCDGHMIIKQHSGYINVYSEPERGHLRILIFRNRINEAVIVNPCNWNLLPLGEETNLCEDERSIEKLFSTVLQAYVIK